LPVTEGLDPLSYGGTCWVTSIFSCCMANWWPAYVPCCRCNKTNNKISSGLEELTNVLEGTETKPGLVESDEKLQQ